MRAYLAEVRIFLDRLRTVRYVGRVVGLRNVVYCDACRAWHHREFHAPSHPVRRTYAR